MTAIVGILCKDGIVVGTDSSATFSTPGIRTIEQPAKKLDVIENRIIVAGTGQIGLGQRFCGIVKTAYDEKLFSKSYLDVGRGLSKRAIHDFIDTSAPKTSYGALVAYT
jgi:20S proteasome alpha/beta subunit